MYPAESPNRFCVRPQETLRPPIEAQRNNEAGAVSGNSSSNSSSSSSDGADDSIMSFNAYLAMVEAESQEPDGMGVHEGQALDKMHVLEETDTQDEYDTALEGNFSICSYGYAVQARRQGPEPEKSVPDFVIDQESQAGERRILAVAELKKGFWIPNKDLCRFNKYGDLIQTLNADGYLDTTNVVMMLILGGYAYSWDFDEWPRSGVTRQMLQSRPYVKVDKVDFLVELARIRDKAPFGWHPPALAG